MILQIDSRFDEEPDIQKYGCQFMSLIFTLNRCGNIVVSTGIILAAFRVLQAQEASYQPNPGAPVHVLGPQCTMNNPDDMVKYFGMDYKRVCRFEDVNYICQPGEEELLQFQRPGWYHWVAGDGKGNVAYDPEGYSLTVRDGHMIHKKIFTIIHKGVNA